MTDDEYIKVESKKKHIIDKLSNYMFNSKLLRDTTRYIEKEEIIRIKSDYKHKYHRNIFIPKNGDTLFWIFYIMVNGIENYELIGENTFLKERNEKIENIEKIKKNKVKLKEYNIKKHSTSENDLLNEKNISIKTFHMLCACYDMDFLLLKNRVYYHHKTDNSVENIDTLSTCPVIHDMGDNIYGCELSINEEVFKNYMETRMKMDNYEKPLKSVTSYTLAQLKELCEILKINTISESGKSKTKSILYADLSLYLTT